MYPEPLSTGRSEKKGFTMSNRIIRLRHPARTPIAPIYALRVKSARFWNTGAWRVLLIACLTMSGSLAAEHHGVVRFRGLSIAGATVTATQEGKKFVTTTDEGGRYNFPELADGVWSVTVDMLGFSKVSRDIGVASNAPAPEWDLQMPLAESAAAPAEKSLTAGESKPAAPSAGANVAGANPPRAAAPSPAAPAKKNGTATPSTGSGNPSLTAALGGRTQQAVSGGQPSGGFQRVGMNQSGDLGAVADQTPNTGLNTGMNSDLSMNGNDSFNVNGSVSRGLDSQQPGGDWMMGGRGDFGMMGPGMDGPPDGMQMGGGRGGPGGPGGPGGGGPPGGGPPGGGPPGGGPGGGRGGPGGGGPGGGGFGGGPVGGPGGGGFGGPGGGGPGGGGFGGPGGGGPGGGPGRGITSFGNNRRDPRSRYNFSLSGNLTNSFLNARTYSVTGQQVLKPNAQGINGNATAGGPLKIPHLLPNGKGTFTLTYGLTRNRTGNNYQGLVPTAAEEQGDFNGVVGQNKLPVTLYSVSGVPYPNNQIPLSSLSSTALALLRYYPAPNFTGSNPGINYENSSSGRTNQDNVNLRLSYPINNKNQVNGGVQYQVSRSVNPNVFGFTDTSTNNGINANVSDIYHFSVRTIATTTYSYSQNTQHATPYFSNKSNIEGALGITGVDLASANWGPPALSFASSGLLPLSDGLESYTHPRTSQLGESLLWIHGAHEFTFGGNYSRRENNFLKQSNPRGTYGFTGAATALGGNTASSGYDLADFLLNTPDTVSLAYSPNSQGDQYYRSSVYAFFVNDQWRLSPRLSLQLGVRWDYQAPTTELYNRLANLDVLPGFTNAAPVLAGAVGSLTGIRYPDSLLFAQKLNLSPRVGLAWRPFAKHSTLVRGGWGIYYNPGVYSGIAQNFGQQPPLAVSYNLSNTCGLTLQSAFANAASCNPNAATNTYGIDPHVRVGHMMNWQLSVQQNLKWNLVSTITYNGIKATGLQQQFAPNTVPSGATPVACAEGDYCTGYRYIGSNGYSFYNSLALQLQRRIRSGLGANLQYVYNKSIDDAPNGLAQNWLNLAAERGPTAGIPASSLNGMLTFSSGVGARGGGLIGGWKGVALKDWTIQTMVTVATGGPLTPSAGALTLAGTGISGTIRPDYVTGEPLYVNGTLNPAAFAGPPSGQWGTLGRDSVDGPYSFSTSASANRTFRIGERKNITFSLRANNPLNHPVVSSWYTNVASSQFGLPSNYAPMRSVSVNIRIGF